MSKYYTTIRAGEPVKKWKITAYYAADDSHEVVVIARSEDFHWWNRSYVFDRETTGYTSLKWFCGIKNVTRLVPKNVSLLAERFYHRATIADRIMNWESLDKLAKEYKDHNLNQRNIEEK